MLPTVEVRGSRSSCSKTTLETLLGALRNGEAKRRRSKDVPKCLLFDGFFDLGYSWIYDVILNHFWTSLVVVDRSICSSIYVETKFNMVQDCSSVIHICGCGTSKFIA